MPQAEQDLSPLLPQQSFSRLLWALACWYFGGCRPSGGPKRLSGAAAMAVAAAQKRAAVSAPAEVSASGTPEPQVPTASAPLQQMPRGSRLGSDALDRSARSEVERVSPDTDAASIIGEALSQRALSDNNESVDKSGYT